MRRADILNNPCDVNTILKYPFLQTDIVSYIIMIMY